MILYRYPNEMHATASTAAARCAERGVDGTDCMLSHLTSPPRPAGCGGDFVTLHNPRPNMIQYLGYFAGLLTVGSFLPQVIRTWRTRQTRDLSLVMFALLSTASLLWIVYGAFTRDWPVILTNSGMVAMNGALAIAKLRYR